MANLLTPNVLRAIYESESQPVSGIPSPVLQILAVKKINSTAPTSTERWRVVLSDGVSFIQSMLATQLNPMVASGEIIKGRLLRLGQYTMNKMKERKYLCLILRSRVDMAEF
jgi:replication factor A1